MSRTTPPSSGPFISGTRARTTRQLSRGSRCWTWRQLDRPEAGEGLIQAFRRERSLYESARLRLRGLEPSARYRIAPVDASEPERAVEMVGRDLLESGLRVEIREQPGVELLTYRKAR